MKRAAALVFLCACSSSSTPPADAGGADVVAAESGPVSYSLSGTVTELDGTTPIVNAKLAIAELPSTFTTTDTTGAFSLSVPPETAITVVITASGRPTTVEQSMKVHADATASFLMVTQTQYDGASALGTTSATTGNVLVRIATTNGCNAAGAHLTTSSGTVVYAGNDKLPNASYTSLQAAAGGWIVGASGSFTPAIADLSSCAAQAWPVELGARAILGPVTIQAGAFHDTSLFLK